MNIPPRVRFAPSPTGKLHLGGARTALSNYLFAKRYNGKFLLRIEDTDIERSKKEYVDQICNSLIWMDLKWDEELVFQSSRKNIYHQAVDQLIKTKKAYKCFASKEELLIAREKTGSFSYSGIWRDRSDADIENELKKGTSFTVRLKNSDLGHTKFTDLIYGEIKIEHSQIDDFIIVRSDGSPVYNLTNVIDDNEMAITHVIRGEDHIANTPKQILIYNSLELTVPVFGHLPMILGPDKKRLSKRHGAIGVQSYQDEGYQSKALLNYLALLGWNPGTEEEIMNLSRLINIYDLKQVQKKSAIFDLKKLDWISGQHLKNQNNKEILDNLRMIEPKWGEKNTDDFCFQIIELNKPRSKSLRELIYNSAYFFKNPSEFDQNDIGKVHKDETIDILLAFTKELQGLSDWSLVKIEVWMKLFIHDNDLNFGSVMKPVRFFISGVLNGASLFEIIFLLGKDLTTFRLKKGIEILSNRKESD